VLVTGSTQASDFPITSSAYQSMYAGGNGDGFVAVLDSDLSVLLYGSYFGGTGTGGINDRGRTVWGLPNGGVLVAGSANSSDFPVSGSALQTQYGGGERDGWIAKLNP